jgi:hypothetical protein
MSVAALAIVALRLVAVGATHEADEGAAAHLWQLLMAGQALPIAWFALRWLPKDWRSALPVLAAQALAIAAAAAPVALLGI